MHDADRLHSAGEHLLSGNGVVRRFEFDVSLRWLSRCDERLIDAADASGLPQLRVALRQCVFCWASGGRLGRDIDGGEHFGDRYGPDGNEVHM